MIMFIVNMKHTFSKVTQYTDYAVAGVTEHYFGKNQLWQFSKDSNNPEYFFIENIPHPGYKITKWCYKDDEMGVFNGQFNDNQQWELLKVEDNLGIEWDYYM